jgi:hypothetical protein
MKKYKVFNLQFSSELDLSGPEVLGLDACIFNYPAGADYPNVIFSLVFVSYPAEARESMQMNNDEFLEYARMSFLGDASPASNTEIYTVFNSSVDFLVSEKTIAKSCIQKSAIVQISDDDSMVIAFEISQNMNADEAQKQITHILQSMSVVER